MQIRKTNTYLFDKVVVILCLSIGIAGHFNSVFLLVFLSFPVCYSPLLSIIIILTITTKPYHLTIPIHNREEAIISASEFLSQR